MYMKTSNVNKTFPKKKEMSQMSHKIPKQYVSFYNEQFDWEIDPNDPGIF